jgi:dephospho-CoA kinase
MPSERGYLRIGVTGGIGAGKSAVCAAFARKGREVLSADAIARAVMESDPSVRKDVAAVCGPEAYRADGTLDTRHVGAVIFADERKRKKVNAAVHPVVIRRIGEEIDGLPDERRRPYVIVEAALLYESGMQEALDAVLVVHASEAVRIERLLAREALSKADVVKRMRAQMPAGEKRERADFVLINEGTLTAVEERVAFFDTLFIRMEG